MENLIPVDQIPEKWLEKSRCPVCSTAPLLIDHPEGEPDRFFCPTCELCFQVAKNHPSIFILQDPLDSATGYLGQWVDMKTLIENSRAQKKAPERVSPAYPAPAPKTAVEDKEDEEKQDPIYKKYPASLINSAADLHEMGNSRQSIKDALARNKQLSEDDIDEILHHVSRQKRKKDAGSFKLPRWAMGCIIVPILFLISYLLMTLYFQYSFSKKLAAASEAMEMAVIDFEKLPGVILNFIPEDVQSMQMPKAMVTKSAATGFAQAACPADVQNAVSLFGGQAADWQFRDGQDAWILQSINVRTLNLPEGYIAIMPYLNKGLYIQITSGPARIQNAYLVMISCP
ncbi:MAG: hypothetical protein JEZ00_17975 [Anaerolineaceae bacterium]|nr:hypothetical protein [Anaerolineaceae bacterium]